jgi:hypothetical protein
VLINCATMLPTEQLRRTCGGHRWFPLKFLGSVKALEQGGKAPLITDSAEAKALLTPHVSRLGDIVVGDEAWVVTCNRIAARRALEAALQIADEIRAHGLPDPFVYAAQTLVARGVIQSYADGTLAHFARQILEEVLAERQAAVKTDVAGDAGVAGGAGAVDGVGAAEGAGAVGHADSAGDAGTGDPNVVS